MAERIRLQRTKGWRKPPDAVTVARPSKWGNPFRVERYRDHAVIVYSIGPGDREPLTSRDTMAEARAAVVGMFERALDVGELLILPSEVRSELAGRDLACWCPLDQPCHADVLLRVAASGDPSEVEGG